jgi:tRNA pseudouridine(55) synthase
MIIPIYKSLGKSTHLLAKKAGDFRGEKATHTGTLDPMAEGVVVVLTGEDRFKKQEFGDVKKTYQFEILWGVSTDSQDLLGLIETQKETQINFEKIREFLKKFVGKQKQVLPKFSARRIEGKSYFDLAKTKKEFSQKSEEVEIFSLEALNCCEISTQDLQKNILEKLGKVEGDFRQAEIIKGWQEFFSENKISKFNITKLEAVTSKRTYIRALVRDLAQELNAPGVTYSILRTQNGSYSIKNCLCLV